MRYYFTPIWMTIMTKKSISKNVEKLGGLPGGPGVKTLPSDARGAGLIPGQGAKISHASKPNNRNIIKQKQYFNKFNVLSCVQLFAILWTEDHQAPLSMGFSRQEYWSGLPFPPPGDLSDPGIEPTSPASPSVAGRFFTTEPPWKRNKFNKDFKMTIIIILIMWINWNP